MASPFDQIDVAVQAAMDRAFGAQIRVEPMVAGNYASAPDPARPVKSARAIVSRAPQTKATTYPATTRRSVERAASPVEAWVSAADLAGLGYALRKGDMIVLPDDPGAPRFAIAALHLSDQGDAQIALVSLVPED